MLNLHFLKVSVYSILFAHQVISNGEHIKLDTLVKYFFKSFIFIIKDPFEKSKSKNKKFPFKLFR